MGVQNVDAVLLQTRKSKTQVHFHDKGQSKTEAATATHGTVAAQPLTNECCMLPCWECM
jgi:hypothetical protein